MSATQLSLHFFLQAAIILATCRIFGLLARKVGQPQVMGEIIAGVVLGPSLLGWFAPEVHSQLFPKASLDVIYVVGQIGLALFMFLLGLEFRFDLLQGKVRGAALVSIVGIAVPLAAGGLIGRYLANDHRLFSPNVGEWQAALFTGAALAVTAFPVMARIIQDQGLTGTQLGTLALGAGSVNDAAAWSILAVVLATFAQSSEVALVAIGGGLLYVGIVAGVGVPLLQKLALYADRREEVDGMTLAIVLVAVMLVAWFTDAIGIYSVFGTFVLGVATPRGPLAYRLGQLLGPMTGAFLLPFFFVSSGLNTRIGLLNAPSLLALTLIIIVVASGSKGVACWLAARLGGIEPHDAIALGALMNARGLMELVLLNIGLSRGIITPTLFTVLVFMTIVTTLGATPILRLALRQKERSRMVKYPQIPGVVGPE